MGNIYSARNVIMIWGEDELPAENITLPEEKFVDQKNSAGGTIVYQVFADRKEVSVTLSFSGDYQTIIQTLMNDAKELIMKSLQVYDGNTGEVLLFYKYAAISSIHRNVIQRREGGISDFTLSFVEAGGLF